MPVIQHNPGSVLPPCQNYSHAVEGDDNIASLGIDLASPDYDAANVAHRRRFLGTSQPASTVVCCQLLEPEWKIEIDAVAAL